jgi:hypothetical protein
MIEVARRRLQGIAALADIGCGNVLERQSYVIDALQSGFDLIFTYGVVQQLPRSPQMGSCFTIAEALAPGGLALIFDNDAESPFGRRMGLRKFLTRHSGLGLVPEYYCNASYQHLKCLRSAIANDRNLRSDMIVRDDRVKRAIVVIRQARLQSSGGQSA